MMSVLLLWLRKFYSEETLLDRTYVNFFERSIVLTILLAKYLLFIFVEDQNDVMTINAGKIGNRTIGGLLSGDQKPFRFVSSGNNVNFRFSSDSSISDAGFRFNVFPTNQNGKHSHFLYINKCS